MKRAIITWIAIYPLITLVLWQLGPKIQSYPVAVQTLILTVIVIPVMTFALAPPLNRLCANWLQAGEET